MKKLPPPLEKDVLHAIRQYLELSGALVIRCNSGAVSAIYNGKKRFLRFNSEPGLSDLLCCVPCNIGFLDDGGAEGIGLWLALEIKRNGKTKATPQQKWFGLKVARAGGAWACVASIEEVRAVLKGMGAVNVP